MMYNTTQEPDIPAALSMLNHLSNSELNELLNDDVKFENAIAGIKEPKDLETEKEMLMASNRSLAEFNLAKQPELEEGKKTLWELGEKGSALCTSVQEKIDIMKEHSGSMTVERAFELLQAATIEIEEESENLAEKFRSGSIEVDEFLEQFSTRRKIMHLRKVKIDKMRELKPKSIRSSGSPGNSTSTNFSGMAPAIPYPTGAISMPMPVASVYRPY